jgi:hypothetical protein
MQWVYLIIAGFVILLLMVAGIPILEAGAAENPAGNESAAVNGTADMLAVLGTAPVLLVFGLLLLALVVVLLQLKGVKVW